MRKLLFALLISGVCALNASAAAGGGGDVSDTGTEPGEAPRKHPTTTTEGQQRDMSDLPDVSAPRVVTIPGGQSFLLVDGRAIPIDNAATVQPAAVVVTQPQVVEEEEKKSLTLDRVVRNEANRAAQNISKAFGKIRFK